MGRLLRLDEYRKLNESFADIALRQWTDLKEATDEVFEGGDKAKSDAIMNSIAKALHLKPEELSHANNLSDEDGIAMFMDLMDKEKADRIKKFDLADPCHTGKNITVEVYQTKTFLFAYFAASVNGKPTDNIVISDKKLDELADD